MARRSYRQRRRHRKGRWSANIQRINQGGTAYTGRFGDFVELATNPSQANNTVSQTYTVKNIEVSGQLEVDSGAANASAIEELSYYIMYLPEGYPQNLDLPFAHPEWIMAYKYAGQNTLYNTGVNSMQPPKITTRLSRKLNTGDKIVFMYIAYNNNASAYNVKFQGLVRWWTKAN